VGPETQPGVRQAELILITTVLLCDFQLVVVSLWASFPYW
jgi:hypothetical protein